MPTIKYLDLIMSAQPKPGYIDVKQNDADGVQLNINLKNTGGTAYVIPDGALVTFLAVKSDGKGVILSTTDQTPRITYSGNNVIVTLSAQVLAVAGYILCNITISKAGATTSTQTFTLSCADALTANDLTSSSEFQSLSKMLADLTARQAEFDAINDKIANMALGYGGTFPTLAALQADSTANTPDGKKRFYIVAVDGHHYYWSTISSAWADGGAIIPYADVVALKNDVIKIFGDIGIGIEYGCEVLPSSPPTSNTVYVTAGVARLPNGQTVTISGQTVTMYGYGYGIIFINSSGAIDTLAGDDINDPVPATPDGALLLAKVYLSDGTSTLDASMITDMRKFTYGLRSYVKNTTYESIGARMNAIEEDAETLEARVAQAETEIDALQVRAAQTDAEIDALRAAQAQMSTDTRIDLPGTGKVTQVPKNAAVMGVGGTVKGMTLTNLIKNTLADWAKTNSTLTLSNGVYQNIADGTGAEATASQTTTGVLTSGRKYYISAKVRVTNSNATSISLQVYSSTAGIISILATQASPVNGQWYTLSGIFTATGQAGNLKVLLRQTYVDSVTASGKVMEFRDVNVIDLISHGLDSKTAADMGYYCPNYISGTQSVIPMRIRTTDANGNTKSACYIEPSVLRRNASGIYDEIDLRTGRLTTRLDSSGNALSTPVYKDNVISGSLISYPKGSIVCEPAIADAGVYDDGITILRTEYPIQSLETLCVVNADGTQTPLDVSTAVVASGGLSFTHPSIINGDIVAFTYFTATSGVIGENVYNYVNANGLTLGADGKYYKVGFAIDINGNISLTKTEVV